MSNKRKSIYIFKNYIKSYQSEKKSTLKNKVQVIKLMTRGGGDTPYSGLYGEAPPESVAFL